MVMRRTLSRLLRLLRLRQLEEDQSRQTLEAAVVERDHAQRQFAMAAEHQTLGRRQFVSGVLRQNPLERTGAVLEIERAAREQTRLLPMLEAAEIEVTQRRALFLAQRTDRRQVETLVENERLKSEVEVARRAQQMLDDWYGRRSLPEKPRAGNSLSRPAAKNDAPVGSGEK